MTPDTEAAAARLAELLKLATAGPWEVERRKNRPPAVGIRQANTRNARPGEWVALGMGATREIAEIDADLIVAAINALPALLAERAEHLAHPAPADVVGEVPENYATVMAWLDEAEKAWTVARDDSGYSRSASWSMDYGRKLIFDYRRLAQHFAAAPPVPPAVVPGWRPTGFNLPVSHWGGGKIVSAEDTMICECYSAQMTGEVIAALNAHWLASAPEPGEE